MRAILVAVASKPCLPVRGVRVCRTDCVAPTLSRPMTTQAATTASGFRPVTSHCLEARSITVFALLVSSHTSESSCLPFGSNGFALWHCTSTNLRRDRVMVMRSMVTSEWPVQRGESQFSPTDKIKIAPTIIQHTHTRARTIRYHRTQLHIQCPHQYTTHTRAHTHYQIPSDTASHTPFGSTSSGAIAPPRTSFLYWRVNWYRE